MADNYITLQEEKGSINVSEDVIISLVNKVVNEIDGVAGLATTAGSELAELIGIKNVNKGTKVQIKEDSFVVDVLILVKYHYNLVDVAKKVQDAIYDGVIAVTGVETEGLPRLSLSTGLIWTNKSPGCTHMCNPVFFFSLG